MTSLLIAFLSACVLVLAGTVVILASRLRAAETNRRETELGCVETKNTKLAALSQRRERAVQLCMDLKRSLTHIHTTAPSSIPGLSIGQIQLLCADELKDRVAVISNTFQNGMTDQLAQAMNERDAELLDEWIERLSAIAEEGNRLDAALTSIFKTWSCNSTVAFDSYEQRLAAVSRRLEELYREMQALLCSVSEKRETGEAVRSVPERIRQASFSVSDSNVRAALLDLEKLVRLHYESLDRQTKTRVESYYLQTLELVLRELDRAEQAGENPDTKAQLSIRVIHVLSNIIASAQRTEHEISERSLEAEVVALERLAAMRGDIAP